tara:strand:- start:2033 stop:2551 length:519 start_codon:yes stop_codon:yes gene_type:complete
MTVVISASGVSVDGSALGTGGGKINQVVQHFKSDAFTSTSTSYTTILTADITPSAANSKVLLICSMALTNNYQSNHAYFSFHRDSTIVGAGDSAGSRTGAGIVYTEGVLHSQQPQSMIFLDSPSSTSSITYTVKGKDSNGNGYWVNRSQRDNDAAAYDGRASSSLTLMEILA